MRCRRAYTAVSMTTGRRQAENEAVQIPEEATSGWVEVVLEGQPEDDGGGHRDDDRRKRDPHVPPHESMHRWLRVAIGAAGSDDEQRLGGGRPEDRQRV